MNKIAGLLVIISSVITAQQQMSLKDCEEAFQKNNLLLLAEQYNINIADADVIQSRIWDLPELSGQLNAYNPEGRKIFDIGQAKGAQITQLIYLGGKKKGEIAFAKSNKELAVLQFSQLLVDLKSKLHSAFFNLHYEKLKLTNVNRQLLYLNELLAAYKVQSARGNISLKDEVRLQSVIIQLNNDQQEINNNILEIGQLLKMLTGITEDIETEISDEEINEVLSSQPFGETEELIQTAVDNNAEYQYHLKLIDNSKLYHQWQKSLNVPDLNLGLGWDQNGGTFKNELNLVVGIPLPLWKKNQGNVEKAHYLIKQNETSAAYKKLHLETKVQAAYQSWRNHYQLHSTIQAKDISNLETVFNGMLKNFKNGNISLIEFTDFMESYRQSILQIYDMRNRLIQSAAELKQLVQTKIFY